MTKEEKALVLESLEGLRKKCFETEKLLAADSIARKRLFALRLEIVQIESDIEIEDLIRNDQI